MLHPAWLGQTEFFPAVTWTNFVLFLYLIGVTSKCRRFGAMIIMNINLDKEKTILQYCSIFPAVFTSRWMSFPVSHIKENPTRDEKRPVPANAPSRLLYKSPLRWFIVRFNNCKSKKLENIIKLMVINGQDLESALRCLTKKSCGW